MKSLRVLFDYLREAMEQGVELAKLNKVHKFVPTDVASSSKAKSWMRQRPPFGSRPNRSGSDKKDAQKNAADGKRAGVGGEKRTDKASEAQKTSKPVKKEASTATEESEAETKAVENSSETSIASKEEQ